MFKILLICTGNTCRSPMAEAILKAKIKKENLTDDLMVISAGIMAEYSLPASFGAVTVMNKKGHDISGHTSRQLFKDLVETADIILTMTEGHKEIILNRYSEALTKIFTLAEFADSNQDIADPFGGDEGIYTSCANQIEELIEASWEKILKKAGK